MCSLAHIGGYDRVGSHFPNVSRLWDPNVDPGTPVLAFSYDIPRIREEHDFFLSMYTLSGCINIESTVLFWHNIILTSIHPYV